MGPLAVGVGVGSGAGLGEVRQAAGPARIAIPGTGPHCRRRQGRQQSFPPRRGSELIDSRAAALPASLPETSKRTADAAALQGKPRKMKALAMLDLETGGLVTGGALHAAPRPPPGLAPTLLDPHSPSTRVLATTGRLLALLDITAKIIDFFFF